MSLDAYVGEFLVSPVPLELSLNYCTFHCAYCFANLNVRDRKANTAQIENLLRDYPQRRTLAARWLQRGGAVCFSNRVDPFAPSNQQLAQQLISDLVARGIPIQFQTRGPHHPKYLDAALAVLSEPAVWYVSIETWDDSVRRRVTPGAPTVQRRLQTIESLRERGHHVVVGINPCVEEWLPQPHAELLLDELVRLGVHGIWVERLHFSPPQRTAMRPKEREAIGPKLISRAGKRQTDPKDRAHMDWVRDEAAARGLALFSIGQANASTFFDIYHQTYPTTVPTIQDFVNECHATLKPGAMITFDQFATFFTERLPKGVWPIDSYLGASTRSLWSTHQIPTEMTFRDLLAIVYQEPRYKLCPVRLPPFAYAGVWDTDGWIQLVDPQGMPYLVWSSTGHTERIVPVDVALQTLTGAA